MTIIENVCEILDELDDVEFTHAADQLMIELARKIRHHARVGNLTDDDVLVALGGILPNYEFVDIDSYEEVRTFCLLNDGPEFSTYEL